MILLSRPIYKLPSPFNLNRKDAQNLFGTLSQGFGENLVPFYAQLGMKGHNGEDYIAGDGEPVYAAHDGTITKTYDVNNSSPTIGYGIWITHSEGWQTVYFHLQDVLVKIGGTVKAGDLIGHADNTGQYTTGSHLHFGLYPAIPDKGNGYDGAIDPRPYYTLEAITGISNQPNQQNMIVDATLLQKLYNLAFKREPDSGAMGFIGQDLIQVIDTLLASDENKYYSKLYAAAKEIEQEL